MTIFQARNDPQGLRPGHKPVTTMNQIDQEIYNRIAEEFPPRTAIMQKLFRMTTDQMDVAEGTVRGKLEQMAQERYAAITTDPGEIRQSARAAWLVLAFLLEHEAIGRYKAKHPELYPSLPEVLTPEEGMMLADAELMLSENERRLTLKLLQAAQAGALPLT